MGSRTEREKHSKLLGENIGIVLRADELLTDTEVATQHGATMFLALAAQSEIADRDLLVEPKRKLRQYVYREASKEAAPGSQCPECNVSFWKFKRAWWPFHDSCELCGNRIAEFACTTESTDKEQVECPPP